jgi:hypothetical protein
MHIYLPGTYFVGVYFRGWTVAADEKIAGDGGLGFNLKH